MGATTCQISISLDGFVAGPNQSVENPIGEGGMRLHEWVFPTAAWRAQHGLEGGEDSTDSAVVERMTRNVGAVVMGRRMFGGGDGPWDEAWQGWWGDDPPFHSPVFVLTHHPRETLSMAGVEAAFERAHAAAGGRDVAVAGGASTVRQFLAAGLLDELYLHVVPVLLGAGERLLEEVGEPTLEPVEVVASPAVTHVRYRVVT